jgi:SAM-dependent methyltransferase
MNTIVGTKNEITRNKWLETILLKMKNGDKILDAGAGELKNKKFCQHLNYTSQDKAEYDGVGDSSGLQTNKWDTSLIDIVSDIIDIPVGESSFDIVLCSEVLEHLPEPVLALKELTRVLKPGGSLILTAPFCSLTHFAPFHFSSGFNKYFYMHHLEELGYKIEEITPNGNFFEYMAQELRRLPSIAEKYSQLDQPNEFRKGINDFLSFLEKFTNSDTGSSDMLCFGYHIFAKKL